MSSQQSSSIALRFEQLKREGRMALMPFLMAGDPDLSVTAEVLLSLQASGADMVELGMPYSDPLADGPVIQAAAARALAAGTTPKKGFGDVGVPSRPVIDTCDFVHLLQSPAQRGDGAFL